MIQKLKYECGDATISCLYKYVPLTVHSNEIEMIRTHVLCQPMCRRICRCDCNSHNDIVITDRAAVNYIRKTKAIEKMRERQWHAFGGVVCATAMRRVVQDESRKYRNISK